MLKSIWGCDMQLYVLDANYQRVAIVDEYESLIWTERYSVFGDFKLVVEPTQKMKNLLTTGKVLYHNETTVLMVIEEVYDATADDGSRTLEISGRSMEAILETRVVTGLTVNKNWTSSGTVGQVVRRLVTQICVDGLGLSEFDVIPELYVHDSTSGMPNLEIIQVSIKPKLLYDAVKELCDTAGYGFRIQRQPTSPRMRFQIYAGVDKPNIIFSTALDNISSQSSLDSTTNFRNIAYVMGVSGTIAQTTDGKVSVYIPGLKRRVLLVDAMDIEFDDDVILWADYREQLRQRGREELTKYRRQHLFDGEVISTGEHKYRYNYDLGDTVYLMDAGGKKYPVRVSEYIWAIDSTGLKSYPTFETIDPTLHEEA